MLNGSLYRWRMRRAAKQYAHRLGPQLQRAYGASEHYSAGQIRTSVAKLGLNPKFIAIGYAAYLPEQEYGAEARSAPITIPYAVAVDLFERYRPQNLFSASANPETRSKSWVLVTPTTERQPI